jgi:vacuolar-type H+-ATPase subunit F/Vma7
MSVYVVGDPPLVEAFALIGVPGQAPKPGCKIDVLIADLAQTKRFPLLLVQDKYGAALSEEQLDTLARKLRCLVLEIPGIGEAVPEPGPLLRAVRSAIGAAK